MRDLVLGTYTITHLPLQSYLYMSLVTHLEEIISVHHYCGAEVTAHFNLHQRRDCRHDDRYWYIQHHGVMC